MAEKIDLNTADQETLATLPGIGRALADRIIAFREDVHPFEEVIELVAVSGISERMVRNIEDRLTIAAVPVSEEGEIVAEEAAQAGEAAVEDANAGEVVPAAEAEVAAERAATEEVVAEEVAAPEAAPDGDEGEADGREREREEAPSVPAEQEASTEIPPEAVEEKAPAHEAERPQAVATAEAIDAAEREAAGEAPPAAGRSLGCMLLWALAGAFAGAALTLFFLFLLNGTLLFGGRQRVADLEQELLVQGRDQEALGGEITGLSAELATVTAAQETVAAAQTSTAGQVEELETGLDDLETDVVPAVATLEAQTAAQATRLSGVAAAAASFDAFLTQMRDLLIDLQGPPPTPTAIPTLTPTMPATSTGTPAAGETQTVTPDGPTLTPTLTPPATRTPRPTATPIVRPTATPTD